MTRLNSLRQAVLRYIKLDKQGNYKARKQRAFVLQKTVEDLFHIGQVPSSWNKINPEHFHQLVQYWKNSKLQDATIIRHMGIIRRYLQEIGCSVDQIDNLSLHLHRRRKSINQRPSKIPELSASVDDLIPKTILALQIQFGLTFSETILLSSIQIKESKLWITREIAFNSMDRMIPFRNEKQKNTLKDLFQLTQGASLIQCYGYKKIRLHWQKTLMELSLPANKSWRYVYAQKTYQALLPELGNYHTCWLIRDEMGIKSRNTLWSYLHE